MGAVTAACTTACGAQLPGGHATRADRVYSAACRARHWVGAWRAPPGDAERSFTDQTLRMVVAPHTAGRILRSRLSNRFGEGPLSIASVTMGIRRTGSDVRSGTSRRVRFGGRRSTTIARGAEVLSDPVTLAVTAADEVVVNVYLKDATGPVTQHLVAAETGTYIAAGDHADDLSGNDFDERVRTWFLLDGIDVLAPASTGALAVIGDSITDGFRSTIGRRRTAHNTRYTDYLAGRLHNAGRAMTVLNLGLSGNLVLTDSEEGGGSALARIDDDVLGVPGVTDVLVLDGINDIGRSRASAGAVIAGLHQLVSQLQAARLNVIVGTILPTAGASPNYDNETASRTRRAVNTWIRTSRVPNAVVDFDAALRDPSSPSRLRPRYDSGDHLHPNARGDEVMARAVSLGRLRGPACAR